MKRDLLKSVSVALPAFLGLTACSSLSSLSELSLSDFGSAFVRDDSDAGPGSVDDLLGRIEAVHVECELSQASVRETLDVLYAIVSPQFQGDAVTAYDGFLESVERSDAQAQELAGSVRPMADAAEPFFDAWAANLSQFSIAEMRYRSQMRLEETRARYEEIDATMKPALWAYDAFNVGLHDLSLFLGHDFNASSVAAIQNEVRALAQLGEQLTRRLDDCLGAAEAYVGAAALPGGVEMSQPQSPSARRTSTQR